MKADDVTDTLNLALKASGCDSAKVIHKPRLLSDNGSSYISGDLADWLDDHGMDHVRGAPYHPQTQGKIERWHQTLKNRVLLENYFLPGDQLSPRELAVTFTDTKDYFVSEASVYRLLKAHDLITSPAFIVIKAADEFRDKTTAPNQLWQRTSPI